MEDDLIKFGAALAVGYLIADFLSPKKGYSFGPPGGQTMIGGCDGENCWQSTAYQGYVFGQGHGQQRHQWDFMPHSLPQQRRAYQGVLGVDYTLSCPDQSTANSAGICADGVKAVVSPISQAPPPVAPAPVASVPATPLVPTSSDSGLPVSAVTPSTTTPVATPTVTTVPVTTTPTTPTPVPSTPLGPAPVDVIPHPDNDNRQQWQQWSQNFRRDLREDLQHELNRRGQMRGERYGRNSGWSFNRAGRHAYAGTTTVLPARSEAPQGVILLTTVTPNGLHLDAHGLQPLEPVTVDLNIPLSNVSRTTNLVADVTGHLTHEYNMTRPPGKTYIAAVRVTGTSSRRVGFKSVKI